jgi:hypothetical protein
LAKLTPIKREKFLTELADGQSVASAAAAIGLSRQALYKQRAGDEGFAAEWDNAVETGTDSLEDEAVKRAKSGSDTLLIFMLKARRPDKFKERPIRLKLPAAETAADVLRAQAKTIEAMATGEITPGEAATVSGVLEAKRRAIETVELEARLAKLEQSMETRQ